MDKPERKLPSEQIEEHAARPELQESQAKVVFSLIPYVGTALNEIFFDFPNRVKQNRVNDLVSILKEKIEKLEGDLVSHDYIKSEDFHDLSILTFETATKLRREERKGHLLIFT